MKYPQELGDVKNWDTYQPLWSNYNHPFIIIIHYEHLLTIIHHYYWNHRIDSQFQRIILRIFQIVASSIVAWLRRGAKYESGGKITLHNDALRWVTRWRNDFIAGMKLGVLLTYEFKTYIYIVSYIYIVKYYKHVRLINSHYLEIYRSSVGLFTVIFWAVGI